MPFLIGLIVVLVLIVLYVIRVYNKLVALRERTRGAFAQIDVQLERRHDLIPNLIEVAKKFMQHERDTLEAVVNARAAATQAQINVGGDPSNLEAMANLGAAEGALGGALGRLLAVAEQYPDLKSDTTMRELSEELTTTENKVAFARQSFNDQVRTYQTYKESFPPVVVANSRGFVDIAYLDIDDTPEKREAIQVSFDE